MWNEFAKTIWLWLLLAQSHPTSAATYNGAVASLLDKHCVGCHRAGEVGPFALDSYEAASRRARQIAQVVQLGYMPPWKPGPASLPFHRERRLTLAERNLIAAWAASGAPRGTGSPPPPAKRPPPPLPDRSWTIPQSFEVPAEGEDLYRCFVISSQLTEAQWIDAYEFVPGNRRVVHHALVFFDLNGSARALDAKADGPGYPCFGTPGFLPVASLGGWSPGNGRIAMPAGTAVRAPKGADVVLQIHYHPTGKAEWDQSGVNAYFAAQAPERRLLDIPLISNNIDIPAGLARYIVRDHFELPVDVTLRQIIPHAHFVATSVRAWVRYPNGVRKTVLHIPAWDFNWQDIYQLKQPLALKAGQTLEMEIVYDNSTRNPGNPNHPPRRVVWGPGARDEMAGVHWNVTVDDEKRDFEDLTSSLWGKMIRTIRSSSKPALR